MKVPIGGMVKQGRKATRSSLSMTKETKSHSTRKRFGLEKIDMMKFPKVDDVSNFVKKSGLVI